MRVSPPVSRAQRDPRKEGPMRTGMAGVGALPPRGDTWGARRGETAMRLSLAVAGAVFVSLLASSAVRGREDGDEFVKRGDALLEKGEFEKAAKEYDRAITLDPKDVRAYLGRGAARSAGGDP